MKKLNIILVASALALSATACTEKLSDQQNLQTFTAGIESSKAAISGVNTYWQPGDQIILYNGESAGATYSTNITSAAYSASFTGTGAVQYAYSGKNLYMAFYPKTAINNAKGWTGSYVYYVIPEEQIAVTNGIPSNAMAMVASSETEEFYFHHVNAYLKFTIDTNSPEIASIAVTDNNGSKISGDMRIVNGSLELQVNSLASAVCYDHVVLKSSDGKALPAGDYYVALRARKYEAGLTFMFLKPDGENCAVKSIESSLELNPGQVAVMGTVKNLSFTNPVGTAYNKGNDKGIIYKVNANGTARVISVWATKYATAKQKFVGEDLSATADYYNEMNKVSTDYQDGSKNVAGIKASATYAALSSKTWAFSQCDSEENGFQDGGWYLPGEYELVDLYRAYYGLSTDDLSADYNTAYSQLGSEDYTSKIDAARKALFDNITSATDTSLADEYYWSSTFTSKGKVYWIWLAKKGSRVGNSKTTSSCAVRCVKSVKIQ